MRARLALIKSFRRCRIVLGWAPLYLRSSFFATTLRFAYVSKPTFILFPNILIRTTLGFCQHFTRKLWIAGQMDQRATVMVINMVVLVFFEPATERYISFETFSPLGKGLRQF